MTCFPLEPSMQHWEDSHSKQHYHYQNWWPLLNNEQAISLSANKNYTPTPRNPKERFYAGPTLETNWPKTKQKKLAFLLKK